MSAITLIRTDKVMPDDERSLDGIKALLFGAIDGFSKDDRSAWRRLWKRIKGLEAGEMMRVDVVQPRSSPYHRRHMAIEQAVFDAQERFVHFEMFRAWVKVGAGWVDWCAGPKGGVVPIPKSVSYAAADQDDFTRFHAAVMEFLRGPHAAPFLWRHLGADGAAEMMESVLGDFNE
jgi:hypothetical protein